MESESYLFKNLNFASCVYLVRVLHLWLRDLAQMLARNRNGHLWDVGQVISVWVGLSDSEVLQK